MKNEILCWSFISMLLFNILIFPFFRHLKWNAKDVFCTQNGTENLIAMKWGVFLFCLFAGYAGDWHHYKLIVEELVKSPNAYTHMEDMYPWLIKHLCFGQYFIFRFIVWGGAVWLYQRALCRLGMDNIYVWTSFAAITLTTSFAIGRGSLGFGLAMFGYSYLLKPTQYKALSILFGCLCIGCSLYAHKSIFLFVPPILFSFFKLNLKRSLIIAVTLPSLVLLFRNCVMEYMSGATYATAGAGYLFDITESSGIGINLWRYSCYLIFYSILGYFIINIIVRKFPVEKTVKRIFFFTVFIWLEYLLMYFAFTNHGEGSDALSYRIFTLTYVSLPVLLGYAMKAKWNNRFTYGIFMVSYFTSNYFLLYNLYTNALA